MEIYLIRDKIFSGLDFFRPYKIGLKVNCSKSCLYKSIFLISYFSIPKSFLNEFYFILSWPFSEVGLKVILWMPNQIRASSTITSAGSSTWAGQTHLLARVPTTAAANAWPTWARTRRRCSTRAEGQWTRLQCRVIALCQEGQGLPATLNTVHICFRDFYNLKKLQSFWKIWNAIRESSRFIIGLDIHSFDYSRVRK